MTTHEEHPLTQVLQGHKEAPEVKALMARAGDEAHLTPEEIELLENSPADEDQVALRRARQHLLLCEACNGAWLGQTLRADEEPPQKTAWRRERRWPQWAVAAFLLGGTVYGLMAVWPQSAPPPGAGRETAIAPAALAEVLHLTWIGRGGFGPARERSADRLYAEFVLRPGVSEAHVYLFLVGKKRVEPLHPGSGEGALNPIQSGVSPQDGWVFPSVDDTWEGVVGIALPRQHGLLAEAADRREIAAELTRLIQRGRGPKELTQLLRELPGSHGGDVISAPLLVMR